MKFGGDWFVIVLLFSEYSFVNIVFSVRNIVVSSVKKVG